MTLAFTSIVLHPFTEVSLDADHFKLLERFTVVMYDKSSELEDVNEARRELFCQKWKTTEMIPPSQDALLQHSKRAADQAGVWCTSDQTEMKAPNPHDWGWILDEETNSWVPVWNTLPVVSKACSELVECGCECRRMRC